MKKNSGETTSQPSSTNTPLAIVGIGCLFPQAEDVAQYWANIKNGVDAITEVPESHWRPEDYFDQDPKAPDHVYAKHGGFLSPVDFNPMEYGVLPNALEAIDTSQLLGLVAVDKALKDAGYGAERDFDREKVSVILGVTGTLELVIPLGARLGHPRWREALKDAGVDKAVAEDVMQRISDSYVPWQENSFPGLLGNVVAGRISKHFNFGGTNCVCDAACGSSLSALNLAALELSAGKADMVVTGGIDTFNDIFMYTCFSKTPALSPSGHSRPFDADGDGTTLGEGLGIVVLKRLADAERDGDKIYAVIKGLGASSDGRGAAIYEPNAAGQTKALRRAYEQGGVDPATIELIEAHGTGTKVGDAVEVNALREVFGEADSPWCAIGSVKSQIGHTKAAAGAAGLIKAALALHHKVLPPTIKVKKPQEAVTGGKTPFYVNSEARPWVSRGDHPRRAGISALGFGGSNFHCLLEEYQPLKPESDWKGDVQLVAFSAADENGLAGALKTFPAGGSWNELRLAADRSRAAFDASLPCRLAMVFEKDQGNPAAQLQSALSMLEKNRGRAFWNTPDGTFFCSGAAAGKLGILFPGQGAQYPGMLKDLAVQFPQFLGALKEADAAFAAATAGSKGTLAELIYPRPVFDPATAEANEARLRATEVAQPALGAVSLGAHQVLAAFGVAAEAYAGHSYGELTALCAGGAYDSQALHALSRLRGELMAAVEGDRGSMLAVSAPIVEVEAFLAEAGLNLVLANRNTPAQGVLSGASAEIAKAAELLERRGMRFKQLSVSAAFHSPLVAEAAGPFGEKLKDIPFKKLKAGVFSNTTGKAYPATAKKAKELLASQLASPVDFIAEIEAMHEAGVRTFVEVGPGARLTGMVKAILGERDHQAFSIDSSNGKRSGINDLARTLAQLAVFGYELNLCLWDEGYGASQKQGQAKKKGMSVPLTGANYFKAPPKRPAVAPKPAVVAAPAAPAFEAQPAVSAPATPVARPAAASQAASSVADKPVAVKPEAAPQPPAAPQAAAGSVQEALRITQQSLQALQSLQEQTARLHQQFLEGQESATRSFMSLVEQQRQLGQGVPAPTRPAVEPLAPVVPAPAPTAAAATVPETVAPAPRPVSPPVQAVAPAISSPQPPTPSPAPAVDTAQVSATLLEVIAEKTGYPVEMLELEMTLDADLGIDSIKRVEILSALQEKLPEAPAVKPEDLGTLQTLGQIVEHLGAGMASASPQAKVASPAPAVDSDKVSSVLLEVIAEKTGYPVEMLELEMTLDADLGIDSIKRVEILSALQEKLPEAPAVKPEDLGTLQTLGQIVEHLGAGMAPPSPQPLAPSLSPSVDTNKVSEVLLAVIAEKTGYPVEMLEMEMALDTDLGIDSIKRVEILSALQEKLPEAPAVKPEDLGTLQTLGQIVEHLGTGMAPPSPQPLAPSLSPSVDTNKVSEVLLAVIAEKTGYPVEMLEMEMALDTDLGIDSIKRVEILSALQEKLPEAPAVKPEDLGTLQTLGQIVEHLGAGMASTSPQPLAPSPRPTVDTNKVSEVLLTVIAEKTGYPVEMLEMEMALDTDLGIDSIKRVEILSALQEKLPEAPAVKPEDLGTLQTLGQIVKHLAAGGSQSSASPQSPAPSPSPALDRETVSATLLGVIAEKTGYPVEMLELEMALDTDLGIDSIKRVEILSALQERLPGAPPIKPEHLGTLQTVGQIVDFLASVSGAAQSPTTTIPVYDEVQPGQGIERQVLKVVPLQAKGDRRPLTLPQGAEVWVAEDGSALSEAICERLSALQLAPRKLSLSSLDSVAVPENLGGLILLAPAAGADDAFLQQAFALMQLAGPALNRAASSGNAVLATVSRLNGSFGLAPGEQLADVVSGGLAGLAKTAGHEWPKVRCKALDLAADLQDGAQAIVEEVLTEGPTEVGISAKGRHALKLSQLPLQGTGNPSPVAKGDLVVISGGARGVTAEVAVALAASSQATLLLLGRSKPPETEPAWLAGHNDEGAIKKALIANASAPLKPRDVAQQCQAILCNREIRANIERIRQAGGEAIYRSVDLRDGAAVASVIEEVRRQHGPVKGLIHGAGVLADRLIADKTAEQFELVYSTKIAGLRALLEALGQDDLKFMIMFSSSTGRFGRTGQVDYAVANEVLNKTAQQQARLRPGCRVLSVNWGPWDGGMVTPALKKVFEQEGVGVIDLKAGADYLVQEIATLAGGPVEIVVLGASEEAEVEGEPQSHENIYVSKAFDLEMSIEQYPFLRSHVIDGKAVLPMAMIIEWMAHGAIHNNPGLRFHGFNDLRILKGVTLEQGQTHSLQVMTGKAFKSDGFHVVPVELSGTDKNGKQFVHCRAKMVLAGRLPEAKAPAEQLELGPYPRTVEDIYKPDRLFHGPDFHGIREMVGCSNDGVSSLVRPAPLPERWIAQPLRNSWLSDPLALDSSFQMMILWSFERYRAASLPVFAGRYRQYCETFPASGAEIRIRVTRQSASKAAAEIDFLDPTTGALVARMEDYECVIDASLNESFQRNKLQGAA